MRYATLTHSTACSAIAIAVAIAVGWVDIHETQHFHTNNILFQN